MPRRQCQEAPLARDHRLASDQARHRASTRRPSEPEQRDRFPAAWPSTVPCTTWRPCSTSGCRRRPARHRAPSCRSEARCRTVNTGLIATGGAGPYAAWPSMRPAPVRCWFTGRVPALRLPRPGALPLLMRYLRPWFLRANRNHQGPRPCAGPLLQGNHSGPDNSGKPVKFLAPPGKPLKCHRGDGHS